MVEAYLKGLRGELGYPQDAEPVLSESEVDEVKNIAGGSEGYDALMDWAGENLSKEDLCVQDLADELALSRSKLYRKIKELTGKSANEMIRKMRLEKSKELLEITDMTIGEICYKVGFSSPSYYTKRFKEYTGLIPKEYRLNNKDKKELSIQK